ncbi:MBOAT, membrane-bound O-acyltransferase family protein [[Clostridium] bifermentans ATCC 638]|uniref:MBOAT, membrane-bound O-acyltransferase family protein n=1 Tax=Paraclostridium bifermentans ATCC 638 = DSM 14991 TaxID=1233171 RepID=T4VI71_PARBF|nr:MBOAT family O-acyltransferase [Paraclostridium bifermentans]EQK41178.1 MBOAT, membrane-bound O-acyltransferase family protein [[Clostridium] bifermentans ATCC 638] [Paraclostridium bifermentans ATCC 638 = DSM 14991]MDU3804455.1 MBOAT family O-acyltransferase [Paraclostridium bifermentans]RIZ57323.1 MBOAT family protein [Paraclostridium bifermentans]UAG18606.1 MBOAT family protein [Paraclostridium bifermentans]
MVFSSIVFLFTFLPITLILYYISPRKMKNIVLLLISLIFYAWGEPVYVFLMMFTTVFDYLIGLLINKYRRNKIKSKRIFIFAVLVNLGILGFFKYYGFVIENINSVFSLNIGYNQLPLPIGISFYTFQTLSYVIDVYLDKVKVQKSLISFGLYVTMFPQLVAGPIVRYTDIDYQLKHRTHSMNKFGEGVDRFIQGLSKKVLLANNIGMIFTSIQQYDASEISVLTAWLAIAAYTLQLYFDFSGYSDMAIGLGKMLGFDFIENFNYPYISKSVTEFWRRWHISLGSWFREYVYIPLGGNRCSTIFQLRNLCIVWFLTGLWHGADWNFILWGLYYGLILIIEKFLLKDILERMPSVIQHIYTMVLVMIGWTFFGIESIQKSLEYIKVMFFLNGNKIIDSTFIYYLHTNLILLIILILCSTPIVNKVFKKIIKNGKMEGVTLAVIVQFVLLFLSIAYLVNETYNPFLYFRF